MSKGHQSTEVERELKAGAYRKLMSKNLLLIRIRIRRRQEREEKTVNGTQNNMPFILYFAVAFSSPLSISQFMENKKSTATGNLIP